MEVAAEGGADGDDNGPSGADPDVSPAGSDGGRSDPGARVPPRRDPGARIPEKQNRVFGVDGVESMSDEDADAAEASTARPRRHLLAKASAIVIVTALLVAAPVAFLSVRTRHWRYPVERIPAARVGLVIAPTGSDPGTTQSLVSAADELRRGHLIQEMMLAGPGFANVTATPSGSAVNDAGATTIYDACHRASRVHGFTDVVIVTARDDLDRALYVCRAMGIVAVGIGVGPDHPMQLDRLAGAVKTLWKVNISRPGPVYPQPDLPTP